MKEYRITSADIIGATDQDCYLDPNDPVWEMMGKKAPVKRALGEYINANVVDKEDPNEPQARG